MDHIMFILRNSKEILNTGCQIQVFYHYDDMSSYHNGKETQLNYESLWSSAMSSEVRLLVNIFRISISTHKVITILLCEWPKCQMCIQP